MPTGWRVSRWGSGVFFRAMTASSQGSGRCFHFTLLGAVLTGQLAERVRDADDRSGQSLVGQAQRARERPAQVGGELAVAVLREAGGQAVGAHGPIPTGRPTRHRAHTPPRASPAQPSATRAWFPQAADSPSAGARLRSTELY